MWSHRSPPPQVAMILLLSTCCHITVSVSTASSSSLSGLPESKTQTVNTRPLPYAVQRNQEPVQGLHLALEGRDRLRVTWMNPASSASHNFSPVCIYWDENSPMNQQMQNEAKGKRTRTRVSPTPKERDVGNTRDKKPAAMPSTRSEGSRPPTSRTTVVGKTHSGRHHGNKKTASNRGSKRGHHKKAKSSKKKHGSGHTSLRNQRNNKHNSEMIQKMQNKASSKQANTKVSPATLNVATPLHGQKPAALPVTETEEKENSPKQNSETSQMMQNKASKEQANTSVLPTQKVMIREGKTPAVMPVTQTEDIPPKQNNVGRQDSNRQQSNNNAAFSRSIQLSIKTNQKMQNKASSKHASTKVSPMLKKLIVTTPRGQKPVVPPVTETEEKEHSPKQNNVVGGQDSNSNNEAVLNRSNKLGAETSERMQNKASKQLTNTKVSPTLKKLIVTTPAAVMPITEPKEKENSPKQNNVVGRQDSNSNNEAVLNNGNKLGVETSERMQNKAPTQQANTKVSPTLKKLKLTVLNSGNKLGAAETSQKMQNKASASSSKQASTTVSPALKEANVAKPHEQKPAVTYNEENAPRQNDAVGKQKSNRYHSNSNSASKRGSSRGYHGNKAKSSQQKRGNQASNKHSFGTNQKIRNKASRRQVNKQQKSSRHHGNNKSPYKRGPSRGHHSKAKSPQSLKKRGSGHTSGHNQRSKKHAPGAKRRVKRHNSVNDREEKTPVSSTGIHARTKTTPFRRGLEKHAPRIQNTRRQYSTSKRGVVFKPSARTSLTNKWGSTRSGDTLRHTSKRSDDNQRYAFKPRGVTNRYPSRYRYGPPVVRREEIPRESQHRREHAASDDMSPPASRRSLYPKENVYPLTYERPTFRRRQEHSIGPEYVLRRQGGIDDMSPAYLLVPVDTVLDYVHEQTPQDGQEQNFNPRHGLRRQFGTSRTGQNSRHVQSKQRPANNPRNHAGIHKSDPGYGITGRESSRKDYQRRRDQRKNEGHTRNAGRKIKHRTSNRNRQVSEHALSKKHQIKGDTSAANRHVYKHDTTRRKPSNNLSPSSTQEFKRNSLKGTQTPKASFSRQGKKRQPNTTQEKKSRMPSKNAQASKSKKTRMPNSKKAHVPKSKKAHVPKSKKARMPKSIHQAKAQPYTYREGGFSGTLNSAVLDLGVLPCLSPTGRCVKSFSYKCGDTSWGFSQVNHVTVQDDSAPLSPASQIAIVGDLSVPQGQKTIDSIAARVGKSSFNAPRVAMVLHNGDISYADNYNRRTRNNSYVLVAFMNSLQSVAASVPYMTAPGNHERQFNFSAYRHWFPMPYSASHSSSPFWFSFDYLGVHVLSFSTEHPLGHSSAQYAWMEQDLKTANENRARVPWVVAMAHRPLYCTSVMRVKRCEQHAAGLRHHVEKLLYEQRVDVVVSSHNHQYERTFPVYRRKVVQKNYTNTKAPVYIVNGAAGNPEVLDSTSQPDVAWRAGGVTSNNATGYLLMTPSASRLTFDYVMSDTDDVADSFVIIRQ